ncbi:MAG: hypothetical protein IPF98_07625 [Gemmatimonadetes bacterium]|nr:hypothetical protein [Gemmatimonadota bacterium]MCC6773002.1 hypothetical protein [Gemmatimonadaceae bacterium]
MALERSPFLKLDRQMVLGELKSIGSRDADVLHVRKSQILTIAKFPKHAGTYVMVVGALCTALILLAFIGIPLLILGWWMRRRGVQNVEAVELGWNDFMGVPPARVVGAVSA